MQLRISPGAEAHLTGVEYATMDARLMAIP
jgi:hypothetical protein